MTIFARNFLLFFVYLIVFFPSSGQVPSYVFHQLSIKEGLSEGTVRSIIEDSRGYMWFGTEDGLNKYDGYKFTVYKTNINNKYSITSNNIKCFYNDRHGNLWVGTRHGMSIYDHIRDRFHNPTSGNYSALQYILGDIESIFEDAKGVQWVITSTHGLYKVSSLSARPEKFEFSSNDNSSILIAYAIDRENNFWIGTNDGVIKFNTQSHQFEDYRKQYGHGYQVRDMYLDSTQTLWLATTEGIKRINTLNRTVKTYESDPLNKNSINGNNTIRILPEKDKLLIAIDGSGIDLFDPATELFHHYTKESGAQLSSNNTTAIYKDSKGTLWTGSFLNGINFSNSTTNFFVLEKNNSPSEKSLKSGVVTSFLKDHQGNFWISTDGGGLYVKKKKQSERFINHNARSAKPLIGSNSVICLLEDNENNVWISTYAGGLTRLMPSGDFEIFNHDPKDPYSLCWDKLKALAEYKDEIWVTSYGMGLSVFNKKTKRFRHYRHDPSNPNTVISDWSYSLLVDDKETLWIGTFKGLCKFIPEKDEFKTYLFNTNDKDEDKNFIFDIFEDSRHNFWLGTNGGGLILLDRDKEKFEAFNTSHGLSDNAVKSVIEDNNGNLWLATNNGITKFNIDSRKATAYSINDGLPPCSFFYDSKYKDEKGKIYFGTNEGYLIIDPSLSTEATDFPRVALTELSIFNNPVIPGDGNSFLDRHISEAHEIRLPYNQNSLSFEFAALNFNIPKHNYYSYKLDGFEETWNYTGKNRLAKYTNIDPGTYVFKVRASNNEKLWSEEVTSFVVIIEPPFWSTWWFKLVMIISAVSFITGFFYYRTNSIRRMNKRLSIQVNERTKELKEANDLLASERDNVVKHSAIILEQQKVLLAQKDKLEKSNEKLEEWNQFQNRLIGILGHDIRGPLQSFVLLLEYQEKEPSEWLQAKLRDTAVSLSMLATDLLGWVNFQSTKREIEYTEFPWSEVIEKAMKQVETNSKAKKIQFSVKSGDGHIVRGVPQVALSCLRNILSNCIRFSKENGVVELETGEADNHGFLRITDYGEGFDAVIVNRLIQGEAFRGMKDTSLKESAGLGMAICYDMIKRTGGHIEAASLPDSGATFYICLPFKGME